MNRNLKSKGIKLVGTLTHNEYVLCINNGQKHVYMDTKAGKAWNFNYKVGRDGSRRHDALNPKYQPWSEMTRKDYDKYLKHLVFLRMAEGEVDEWGLHVDGGRCS